MLQRIRFHRLSIDEYFPLRGFIKPRNQLDQRRLGRTGAADNPHGLPRFDVETDIGQDVLLRILLIFK